MNLVNEEENDIPIYFIYRTVFNLYNARSRWLSSVTSVISPTRLVGMNGSS